MMKVILNAIVVSSTLVGCATLEVGANDSNQLNPNSGVVQPLLENKTPNQYGWDDSNCAHILADGTCAHEL
jgi:hypothetical protein